ncbi:enoylCoA hydratase/isomerase family putative [Conidiobolus coronatus NRRL 28638]|uniref:EnoylCoA hydratase/isomerase family putative n=1 Tax=Conidiobolus coronatus (strain ATCC 28846 / CBS 209.66 / NRRL 28638) TaxID=796925 RepID=A0A137P7V7_CONC2|nr:enoylCoA hydratase/isomerase family putative [Conidiobolus coronatus NRRL 28638]|eukprot:KXN71107.1 enoylCoA hydratase/isomerase family putative [Conidiobolus coronatus NRRL 28638]
MLLLRSNIVRVNAQIARASLNQKFNIARLLSSASETSKLCYLEKLQDEDKGIAVLNMNRPAAKNAISIQFLTEFRQALEEVQFDSEVRVLILRSLVDRVFCAGADLKERAGMSQVEVTKFLHNLRQTFCQLETLPQPTIASVDGAALGGGLEMALSCDMRVAGTGAKVGLPETNLAIIPGAGGTQRLTRLVGVGLAKELIFTARVLTNEQAREIGLVNHAVKESSSYDKAINLAREILPKGPLAIRMAKIAIDRGIQVDKESGLEIEQLCYAPILKTKDRLEGLAAFKEKRKPSYKGE